MRNAILLILVLALTMPAAAGAQQKAAIGLKTIAEVEVVEQGAQGGKIVRRVEAALAKVTPGDTVIFTTTCTNTGRHPATGVVVTNPVPEHMVYVDKSAGGADTRIEYSVDNGKTYAAADKLTIKSGAGAVRPASAADYTYIKWTLVKPLAAGGTGSVTFKARVK